MVLSPEAPGGSDAARDKHIVLALMAWFADAARALPWRVRSDAGARGDRPYRLPRDPYRALVSEFMLQQTQVSRVLEFFPRFVARFPSVSVLADADEADVLAAWAGLGYYRRARFLHAAAKAVVAEFGGRVPSAPGELRRLPGVGRYTAGAIASIVFGLPEPAVDGNVTRVLLRVEGQDLDPAAKATMDVMWTRAEDLARAAADAAPHGAGVWNEALMELGATVCLPPPAAPRCDACPLAVHCRARAAGTQGRIPRPKRRVSARTAHAAVVVVRDHRGCLRLEQRGPDGLWAGLWQPPTLEAAKKPAKDAVAEFARLRGGDGGLTPCGGFEHTLTHRRLMVQVYAARAVACRGKRRAGVWIAPDELDRLGVSNMHKRAIALAAKGE